MERTASNKQIDSEDVHNEENSEIGMINSHITEYLTLKDSLKNSNKKIQSWMNHISKLVESNNHIDANYNQLLQKILNIDVEISKYTRINTIKKQELEQFQNTRTNVFHMRWHNCFSEIENYANDISHWITEYCGRSLSKDIENYHEECKPINEGIIKLKRELNDKEKGHNANGIKANMDINDLSFLNTIMGNIKKSDNNLMYAIRSMEDTLHKVQKKIKRNKIIINEHKTREKINEF